MFTLCPSFRELSVTGYKCVCRVSKYISSLLECCGSNAPIRLGDPSRFIHTIELAMELYSHLTWAVRYKIRWSRVQVFFFKCTLTKFVRIKSAKTLMNFQKKDHCKLKYFIFVINFFSKLKTHFIYSVNSYMVEYHTGNSFRIPLS